LLHIWDFLVPCIKLSVCLSIEELQGCIIL